MPFIKFINRLLRYRYIVFAIILFGNIAIMVEYGLREDWFDFYQKEQKIKMLEALNNEKFNQDIFNKRKQLQMLNQFLFSNAKALLGYRLQKEYRLLRSYDGHKILYHKVPEQFIFYNLDSFYEYVPPALRTKLAFYLNAVGKNLIHSFVIETAQKGVSIDKTQANIIYYVKNRAITDKIYIVHAIYVNRKIYGKVGSDVSINPEFVKIKKIDDISEYIIYGFYQKHIADKIQH